MCSPQILGIAILGLLPFPQYSTAKHLPLTEIISRSKFHVYRPENRDLKLKGSQIAWTTNYYHGASQTVWLSYLAEDLPIEILEVLHKKGVSTSGNLYSIYSLGFFELRFESSKVHEELFMRDGVDIGVFLPKKLSDKWGISKIHRFLKSFR